MQEKNEMLIIIGQSLIRIGISFFSCFLLFWTPIEPKHDHQHNENIGVWIKETRQAVSASKEVVDSTLDSLTTALRSDHQAANKQSNSSINYDELCSIYSNLCDKTSREGEFSNEDRFLYQALMIALSKAIDSRLAIHGSIADGLRHIKFYRSGNDRRGSSWHDSVKINVEKIASRREFWEVLTHEFWHVLDLGIIKGNSKQKNKVFTEFGKIMWSVDDPSLVFYGISRLDETTRKSDAWFKDFVSGYATKGVYEDFAESKNMRFNHRDLFLALAQNNDALQAKYNFFARVFGDNYFDDDTSRLATLDNNSRVWDTTRIE